jgi:hypothetical protein
MNATASFTLHVTGSDHLRVNNTREPLFRCVQTALLSPGNTLVKLLHTNLSLQDAGVQASPAVAASMHLHVPPELLVKQPASDTSMALAADLQASIWSVPDILKGGVRSFLH